MKKCCVVLLLSCAGFSLSAQSNSKVSIFFSLVTGIGHSLNDNGAINTMLINELTSRKYSLLNTPQGANFLLYGSLSVFDEYYDYENRYVNHIRPTTTYTFNAPMQKNYDKLYIFQLILRNVKTGEIVLQNVIYISIDDVYKFFPVLVYNLFTHISGKGEPVNPGDHISGRGEPVNPGDHISGRGEPVKPGDHISGRGESVNPGDWLDKYLYLGVNAFWSPRIYYGDRQSAHFVNFGGGVSMELVFLKFMSFEAGIQLVPDWVVYSAENDNYQNLMLEIPVALRFLFKLSDHYILAPYAGALLNIPLYKTTKTPLFSWMIGITGGIRAGPGIFYVEPRYAMDIGNSSISPEPDALPFEYKRFIVHIGVGYKFGFFTKKQR